MYSSRAVSRVCLLQVFAECVKLLKSAAERPEYTHLSLLLCCAALERALGDVSSTCASIDDCFSILHYPFTCRSICPFRKVCLPSCKATINLFSLHTWHVGSQCPSLLRDLLTTRELEDIFGPTAVCTVLISRYTCSLLIGVRVPLPIIICRCKIALMMETQCTNRYLCK